MILLVGLMLRAMYLRELLDKPDFTRPAVDAGFHDYWARALAFGDWRPPYVFPDPLVRQSAYLRPPGYPYFLSLIYTVCGPGYTAPRVVQMALGLVSAALAWSVARRWFGSAVGLTLAGLMAGYWIFIYFEGEFHAVTLVVYLLWLTVYFAGAWAISLQARHALLTGILLGATALMLPNVLVFLPVFLAWMGWSAWRRDPRGCQHGALAIVAGAALAIAPATVRNYIVARDFVLISNNAGINLFIGNNETATGLVADQIAGLGDFKTCFDYPALIANLEHKVGKPLKPSEVSRYFTGQALAFIREHPARFLELTAKKAFLFWGPREVLHNKVIRYERETSSVLSAIPLSFSAIVALAACGIVAALRDRHTPRSPSPYLPLSPSLLFLGVIVAYFLSVLPFFAAARYRAPIIPFLLVFTAYALCRIGRMIAAKSWPAAARWTFAAAALCAMHLMAAPIIPEGRFERAKWHYDRAVAHGFAGRTEPAIAEYRQVLARMPENPHAHLGLGLGLAKLGRTDEAAAEFEEAIRLLPQYPEAHFNLAVALENRGNREGAIARYKEALQVDPGFAEAHYNVGVLLAASGTGDEAMAHYAAAIRSRPDFAPAHVNFAVGLFELGRIEEAGQHFNAAAQLEPFNPEARCNLALTLARLGRVGDAIAQYRAALQIDPVYPRALAELAELTAARHAGPPASTPAP